MQEYTKWLQCDATYALGSMEGSIYEDKIILSTIEGIEKNNKNWLNDHHHLWLADNKNILLF